MLKLQSLGDMETTVHTDVSRWCRCSSWQISPCSGPVSAQSAVRGPIPTMLLFLSVELLSAKSWWINKPAVSPCWTEHASNYSVSWSGVSLGSPLKVSPCQVLTSSVSLGSDCGTSISCHTNLTFWTRTSLKTDEMWRCSCLRDTQAHICQELLDNVVNIFILMVAEWYFATCFWKIGLLLSFDACNFNLGGLLCCVFSEGWWTLILTVCPSLT